MTAPPPPDPPASPAPETTPAPDPEERGLRLVPTLLLLTVLSGMIDAVSFLGAGHVFTANMTGNVVILGFASAGAPGFSVPHSATSLACFVAGAVAGGRVVRHLGSRSRRRLARVSLAAQAALLAPACAVAFALPEDAPATVYCVITLTALAMGLRNAAVRELNVPSFTTTTVVTMTLTGLASDSPAAGGAGKGAVRRRGAVAAMFTGAALGAWLTTTHGPAVPLLIATAVTTALACTASGRE
ncbi:MULTISPECIES: YoaK family protein [unclassified Streptomyces]|uniref:YoaK family protein n=1 Tax=unclassified Streptomyces TaxID=2593676 RepID=UPI00380121FF